ncbi:3'-5' exoribonuclease [Hathewaya proteolytica DSM 3090]|uniref:3'-5' exoribonuclease n=1 Tax=Hathewaya proteolytica DSM 3090 TaxID=1121331 RepID=A0A1M6MQB0_9CLOT|nr:HD domain-containing protein [Hathewaya proteolytica]SHJ85586.1 3'-5' exoribonuclease [Hathewaya proteolytica DSM 3090]
MVDNRMNVNQLQKGDKVQEYYYIKDCVCKLTNGNNAKFLDINLMDRTGIINAKLWNYREEQDDYIKSNIIVFVTGNVIEWKDKLQLKIDYLRKITEEDKVEVDDFVPVAPYSSMDMYEEILKYKENIKNQDIKNIVEYILNEAGPKVMYYPAAKSNHHSVRSGLLYHTLTMLKAGRALSEIYDFVNSDLLYAGIILHDMAKVQEMNSSELGIVEEYSVEGQLLGHIIIGVRNIETAARAVNASKEVSMLLQHMILTHHYEPEYGSPKKPMFPEAELLHHLDLIDARMYDMNKALSSTEPGMFSDKIWSLDNLSVYRNKL